MSYVAFLQGKSAPFSSIAGVPNYPAHRFSDGSETLPPRSTETVRCPATIDDYRKYTYAYPMTILSDILQYSSDG